MTDWHEINERSELRDKELERAILRDIGAERAVRKIARGGADRTKVMRLLVLAVHDPAFWRKPARRLKKQLESFADQLETVANHAERVQGEYQSHAILMTMVLHLFSGKWGKEDPEWNSVWERAKSANGSFAKIFSGFVRLYAKNCRAKAEHIGKMLRRFPPRQRREALDTIMLAVWHSTRRHYDRELAYLLTKAFEASGKTKQFSEDQIKKHRQRHVMPRIRQYLERNASSSTASEKA